MIAHRSLIFAVLPRLLRPLAKLCVRHGLKIQDLLEAAKRAMLAAAAEELASSGEKVNISRLSVMTGIQRKDINRIERTDTGDSEMESLMTKVIGMWQSHPDFINRARKPRGLRCDSGSSEFSRLVETVSKDVNSYTVLFELERLGIVERRGESVSLCSPALEVGEESVSQGLNLLAADTADLYSSVTENIFSRAEIPNLHIKTSYDNIVASGMDAVRDWILREGADFHARAREFISKFDKDLNPQLYQMPAGGRVVLGSFSLLTERKEEKSA